MNKDMLMKIPLMLVDTFVDILTMTSATVLLSYVANMLCGCIGPNALSGTISKSDFKKDPTNYVKYIVKAAVHVIVMNLAMYAAKLAPNFANSGTNVALVLVGPVGASLNKPLMADTKAAVENLADILGM